MAPIRQGEAWRPQAAHCGLFAAVPGRCVADGHECDVPADALLWFEHAPESLSFSAAQAGAGVPGWWLAATATGTTR